MVKISRFPSVFRQLWTNLNTQDKTWLDFRQLDHLVGFNLHVDSPEIMVGCRNEINVVFISPLASFLVVSFPFTIFLIVHPDSFSCRCRGPCHHNSLEHNCEAPLPREHKSAGLPFVAICCHCPGSVWLWIRQTLLATNGRNSRPRPRIQRSTFILSLQNRVSEIGIPKTVAMTIVRRNPNTAASNSSRGILTVVRGATRVFEAIMLTLIHPSRCSDLR